MLNEFLSYLEAEVQNHSIYVIGAQGQRGAEVTEAWIRKRESVAKNAERAVAYWKKQCAQGYEGVLGAFDCSGLGMYWLQNQKQLYKSDMTANGMKHKCTQMDKAQLRKGDWVFILDDTGKATHIGYIVDADLNVIEARGRDYGVCKAPISNRWNWYGRPGIFKSEIEGNSMNITRILRIGDTGEDVRAVQQALISKGYSLPKHGADGSYGGETQDSVQALQKATKLIVDGIVGQNTVEALGLIWGTEEPDYKVLYAQTKEQLESATRNLAALQTQYDALLTDMKCIKVVVGKH